MGRPGQLLAKVALSVALGVYAIPSYAGEVTFAGSGTNAADPGSVLSAAATFALTGNVFTVTLTGTGKLGTASHTPPTDVLTALLFSLPNGVTLTPTSASVPAGSSVLNPDGNSIGAEWEYRTGPTSSDFGYNGNAGIGSAGFGYFGHGNFNCGVNCQNVQGFEWGILSPDYTGGRVGGNNTPTIIVNSAQFVFTENGLVDPSQISNVTFQYGTGKGEPSVPGTVVPEPVSSVLFATVLLVAACFLRRQLEWPG